MQCPLFQSLLLKVVESHSDSISPEVRTHATTCTNPACVEVWAEQTLLAQVVTQWKSELPHVDLTERVLSELYPAPRLATASPPARSVPALKAFITQSWHDFRSPQLRSWSMSLCVVGALLLIGTLIVLTPNSPTTEIAVRQRHNPIAAPPQEQWASRSPQTLHETSTPNVAVQSIEWAQNASNLMATAIVSIPEKGADWIPADNWDLDWKHRLEPIRRDAHAAWDTLLENLPMPNPPST